MDMDEIVNPEVGAAVAATAVILSSRARHWLHDGAVYGLAGVLTAGDAIASFGRGVGRGLHLGAGNGASASAGAGARAEARSGASTSEPADEESAE